MNQVKKKLHAQCLAYRRHLINTLVVLSGFLYAYKKWDKKTI